MPGTLVLRRNTLSAIGLDSGRTAARAVQLTRSDDRWTLVTATAWHLSNEGAASERWLPLQDRLRRALRNQDFAGKAVVVGLSQPDVELHALELPRGQDGSRGGQVDAAARWEIERLSRFEDEEKQTAHWWLPAGRGGGPTAIGAAVPGSSVKSLWDACRDAGADCRRVDVTACALSRAGANLRRAEADQVWGILDLGARSTRLVLCVDEVPVLTRSLETGGQSWTKKIAEDLQVSPEAAERHKCDHGLRPSGSRAAESGGARPVERPHAPMAELAGMIFAALRPELDRVAEEIERSYEYVLQCYPGRKAADLILAGGGAALKRLDQYLAGRLGIPVAQPDAYLENADSRLSLSPSLTRLREPLAAWLGAIGLAIPPEGK